MQAPTNWACSIINHGQLLIGSAFPTKPEIPYDLPTVSCSPSFWKLRGDMTRPVELVSPFFPVPNERLCGARRSVLIKRGSRDRGVDDTFEEVGFSRRNKNFPRRGTILHSFRVKLFYQNLLTDSPLSFYMYIILESRKIKNQRKWKYKETSGANTRQDYYC